ncbi:1,2-phenylacetyl-CoA epoxidase subunit PaaD [Halomarina ordinaria]|uniref:1,2-phenylacetyl-CoA epoxidase subunit PaaD n=1 Tax=Halomarina ordinaria TaxID=3033939 RepID=A0ABD5U9C1_9EURY|nr:1,2-phenylacetyl-CoA epoxidase subunit PaaD [Halomarina sp. PSRA2]
MSDDEFAPDPNDDVRVDDPTESRACAYTSYDRGQAHEAFPRTGTGTTGLERAVWDALYDVEDPEMPVSVVDLGLVYGVALDDREDGAHVVVDFTLTYTGCPAREMLLSDVEEAAASPEGVASAEVRLVWSPPWSVEMVTEAGREDLREFGVSV